MVLSKTETNFTLRNHPSADKQKVSFRNWQLKRELLFTHPHFFCGRKHFWTDSGIYVSSTHKYDLSTMSKLQVGNSELSEKQEFQSWGLVSVRNTKDAASVLMLKLLFNEFFNLKWNLLHVHNLTVLHNYDQIYNYSI